MATKTFDELKQMAIQIRDEKTNKQNTANRIGTEMLEHLDKLEQDYYDKTTTDEELKKRDAKLAELSSYLNISDLYPQGSADGDNLYTFSDALSKVPNLYRKNGLIITFKDKEGFWQTWKNIGATYSYDTITNWILIDYSSRGYTDPTELSKRKKNLEKSLTLLYNIGALVKDGGVLSTIKTIENKYLLASTGITDNDSYRIVIKDVTDIDLVLIEGVKIGAVSNYAFSLDENLTSIIETSQSDRTYPNGVICKPYPGVKYLAISVQKKPVSYSSVYKLKENNIMADKFQQKSDSVKLLRTDLFSLNFGEYNERLQSIINNLSYNITTVH
ncbi:hypothetical protein [Bacteroides ilei]|uniref:hypothetical protein n=1 Tax=Bacteroides ilei TaxID=1907658 RepID=UPI00093096EB|nr:hypothetical protein [Bacteroides ilei]